MGMNGHIFEPHAYPYRVIFRPLSSFWFLVVYATMAIGQNHNNKPLVLLTKITASAWAVHSFLSTKDLPETVVRLFALTCKMNFDANEFFHHRVHIDQYIVYVGMLAAMLYVYLQDTLSERSLDTEWRENHIATRVRQIWPYLKIAAIVAALLALPMFFHWTHSRLFTEQFQAFFTTWQPYITFVPILSFAILRNAHPVLRNYHSAVFAWVGRYSGEMYVMQNHLWLAADAQAVLRSGIFRGDDTVFGDRWRDLVILTPVYFIACKFVNDATGTIANWFSREETRHTGKTKVETPSKAAVEMDIVVEHATAIEDGKNSEIHDAIRLGERLHLGRPWHQRAVEKVSSIEIQLWPYKLKNRVILVLALMWVLNVVSAGHCGIVG